MVNRSFLKAGHPPTLFAAFFYFDTAFMVWTILGVLGIQIQSALPFDVGQRGLVVAMPLPSSALLRAVNVNLVGQAIAGLAMVALVGILAGNTRWRTAWGAVAGVGRI